MSDFEHCLFSVLDFTVYKVVELKTIAVRVHNGMVMVKVYVVAMQQAGRLELMIHGIVIY